MTASVTTSISTADWIEARLPSGRTIVLRGVDHMKSPADEDEGTVQDVRFRGFEFSTLTATLREIGDLVRNAVLPLAPDEAEVELGLGLSASTGHLLVLFGEAAAEASMKVNLRWHFGAEAELDKKA